MLLAEGVRETVVQVWSLIELYSVGFSQSRLSVKSVGFYCAAAQLTTDPCICPSSSGGGTGNHFAVASKKRNASYLKH